MSSNHKTCFSFALKCLYRILTLPCSFGMAACNTKFMSAKVLLITQLSFIVTNRVFFSNSRICIQSFETGIYFSATCVKVFWSTKIRKNRYKRYGPFIYMTIDRELKYSYLAVNFEFRACLAGRCLCSQNINKYSNNPTKGYERIIWRFYKDLATLGDVFWLRKPVFYPTQP